MAKDRKDYDFSQVASVPAGESAIVSSRPTSRQRQGRRTPVDVDFAVTPEYLKEVNGKLYGRRIHITADEGVPVAIKAKEKTDDPTIHTGVGKTTTRGVQKNQPPLSARIGTNDAFRLTVNPDDQKTDDTTVIEVTSDQGFSLHTTTNANVGRELKNAHQQRQRKN